MSVAVAHIACEIAATRKLSEAFAFRGVSDLEEAVTGFISGSNLGNERVRRLYTALTADDVTKQPLWENLVQSARLRNRIAHAGVIATQADAELAIEAATALVKHLGKWGSGA
jgi:hypothetical protein